MNKLWHGDSFSKFFTSTWSLVLSEHAGPLQAEAENEEAQENWTELGITLWFLELPTLRRCTQLERGQEDSAARLVEVLEREQGLLASRRDRDPERDGVVQADGCFCPRPNVIQTVSVQIFPPCMDKFRKAIKIPDCLALFSGFPPDPVQAF